MKHQKIYIILYYARGATVLWLRNAGPKASLGSNEGAKFLVLAPVCKLRQVIYISVPLFP